jgi:hypothetical protein
MDLWVKSPIESRHPGLVRRNIGLASVASEKILLVMRSTSMAIEDGYAIVSDRLQTTVEHPNRAVTIPDGGHEEAVPQPAKTPNSCAIDDPDCEVRR